MRITKRVLAAENTQLKAQLAVHAHETRSGLKAKLSATRNENADLTSRLGRMALEAEEMKEQLAKAKAAQANA